MTKSNETVKRLTWDVPILRSHTDILQNAYAESIGPAVNVAVSRSDLKTSVRHETVQMLTLDMLTRSDRSGDLEGKSKG